MAGIDKIEKVVKILQHTGRLRRTELVNPLEKEGDMQKQTAYDAIDEAVEQLQHSNIQNTIMFKEIFKTLEESSGKSAEFEESIKKLQEQKNDVSNKTYNILTGWSLSKLGLGND